MSIHKVTDIYRSTRGAYHPTVTEAVEKLGVQIEDLWLVVIPNAERDTADQYVAEQFGNRVARVTFRDWFCVNFADAVMLDMRFR